MEAMTQIPESYRTKHKNIPIELFVYFDRLLKKSHENSLFHQAMEHHPEKTFEQLDKQFLNCSKIVSLSPTDLLKKLDFHLNDLSKERVESLLGELHTISFLDKNGFINISPIRASSKNSADFSAEKNDVCFVVEVLTSIYFAQREFHADVVKWALSRLNSNDKLSQLKLGSDAIKNMFVCVLNSSAAVALNTRSNYLKILNDIWVALGSRHNLHIAIVTGRVSLEEGSDDCLFPSIGKA